MADEAADVTGSGYRPSGVVVGRLLIIIVVIIIIIVVSTSAVFVAARDMIRQPSLLIARTFASQVLFSENI